MHAAFLLDGKVVAEPRLLSGTVTHTDGSSSDGADITCLYDGATVEAFQNGALLQIERDGTRLFTGYPDEIETGLSGGGVQLSLSARGFQALLLDREAVRAEYSTARIDDLLRTYAAPAGVTRWDFGALPALSGFTVESGTSFMQVFKNFAGWSKGWLPRFSADGTFIIQPFGHGGKTHSIDAGAPLLSVSRRVCPYGVIGSIELVENTTKKTFLVKDDAFYSAGIGTKEAMTFPRGKLEAYIGRARLRIAEAKRGYDCVSLRLAGAYPAEPGDVFSLSPHRGISGDYMAATVQHTLSAGGYTTSAELIRRPD
ncbi:hypothetical protein LJC32_04955 [Oscillospiraceae bacterium OttesenSCG-928-F05]|nr:hypothetical protein [Oscillospiraceae bacterium OttesenSCG-928-F05]